MQTLEPQIIAIDRNAPTELKLHNIVGRPLKTTFLLTSMPVGGAETLLVNLMKRFDKEWIEPSVICLKEKGPLGEEIAREFPLADSVIRGKFDVAVVARLRSQFKKWKTDAIVTVGAGDKMFWGRIAARVAGVPVICSALHSTGWPDGVGKLNRMLTSITDAFIGVAKSHGEYLVANERFPKEKVFVIPNGIDTNRFVPNQESRADVRRELGIGGNQPIVGIVAALRPEKNHGLFVELARRFATSTLSPHFLIVGDGPERSLIEKLVSQFGLSKQVTLVGSRSDTPRLLSAMDLFLLTSHNEASPVSILEALSCQVPVVASRVGSVSETVLDAWNGFTATAGDADDFEQKINSILSSDELAKSLGENGRTFVVQNASLDKMVYDYQSLIHQLFSRKHPS